MDIQPGEEICVSYCSFARLDQLRPNAGVSPEIEFVICRMTLKAKWGITCPLDCFCKDPGTRQLVLEGRRLNDDINSAAAVGSIEGILKAVEKRLEIEVELNMSWSEIAKLGSELYRIALMKEKTFPKAYQFLKDIQGLNGMIRPHSKYTATLKGIRGCNWSIRQRMSVIWIMLLLYLFLKCGFFFLTLCVDLIQKFIILIRDYFLLLVRNIWHIRRGHL